MLDKIVRLTQFYDWYGTLLTEKQQEVFELYYHHNLSLAEIASEHGVSRPAVHDILSRTEGLLSRYESFLGLVEQFGLYSEYAEQADNLVGLLEEECHNSRTSDIIHMLKEILRKMSEVWTNDHTKEGV